MLSGRASSSMLMDRHHDVELQFDHNQTTKTPHGRLLVETTSGQPDELRVTLADSTKGYALTIYTKAKSPSQAKRVKRELEKFLVNRDSNRTVVREEIIEMVSIGTSFEG